MDGIFILRYLFCVVTQILQPESCSTLDFAPFYSSPHESKANVLVLLRFQTFTPRTSLWSQVYNLGNLNPYVLRLLKLHGKYLKVLLVSSYKETATVSCHFFFLFLYFLWKFFLIIYLLLTYSVANTAPQYGLKCAGCYFGARWEGMNRNNGNTLLFLGTRLSQRYAKFLFLICSKTAQKTMFEHILWKRPF